MAEMTQAQQMLQRYLDAEASVLDGRSITFNGRTMTMVDLDQIRAGRLEWERRVTAEQHRTAGRHAGHSLASFE